MPAKVDGHSGKAGQDHCKRCGNCCLNGGPALHLEDKGLLLDNIISHSILTTVRKGEPSLTPKSAQAEPAAFELLKVSGSGGSWVCRFFDDDSLDCTIYENRPYECSIFECWNPDELVRIVGQDMLVRSNIINADDPILDIIKIHEEECSYGEVNRLLEAIKDDQNRPQALEELTGIVRKDLHFRHQALQRMGMPLQYEMFIFGRPIFVALSPLGLEAYEENGDICLRWNDQQ